jgi:hypothetical protein
MTNVSDEDPMREQRILRPLLEFFSNETNFKIFLDIVVFKTKNIPLRLLDWFVTNFSKKNDVSYVIKRPNGQIENFNIYRSYRAQLKGHSKKVFDPFCRGKPIMLEYESPQDKSVVQFETGICQLKFFKWAIQNLVLTYVENNYDAIYDDMKTNNSKSLKVADETDKQKRKKNELSKSIYQQIHISSQSTVLSFPQTANDVSSV